jgi:hypothetical protein
MLREVVDGNCVDAIWCALARASGTNFQASAFNHSAISPFRINYLQAVGHSVAQNPPSNPAGARCDLNSGVYRLMSTRSSIELCQTS